MEQNEGYKSLVSLALLLAKQLSKCEEIFKSVEQHGIKTEKDIEEHFEKCTNALAARKASLLRECSLAVANQKKKNQETQKILKDSIEGCNKTLEAGSSIYKLNTYAAETVWKGALNLPTIQIEKVRFKISLPATLVDAIQAHGSISLEISNDFKQVEVITTLAGSIRGFEDGKGTNAKFNNPVGCCWSPQDNCLYVCDFANSAIRKITSHGEVSTAVAPVEGARPYAIVINNNKELLVADWNANTINKISPSGASILAGGRKGDKDGEGKDACFSGIYGMAIAQHTGNLFVSEKDNHKIRMITPQGKVSTLAGGKAGFQDGKNAKFNKPCGIFFDEIDQTLLVCDHDNNKLRKVTLSGDVSTVCNIQLPSSVVVTSNRTILVVSFADQVIYSLTLQERGAFAVTALATGNGGKEAKNEGKGVESALFNHPFGIAVDEESNCCFVTESLGHTIRKISFL